MSGTDRIPDLSAEGRVRTNWAAICGAAGVIIAAASLGTAIYLDVQMLKGQTKSLQETVDTLSRQVDRLTWTLNPAPAVTSNPRHGVTP